MIMIYLYLSCDKFHFEGTDIFSSWQFYIKYKPKNPFRDGNWPPLIEVLKYFPSPDLRLVTSKGKDATAAWQLTKFVSVG